MKVLATLPLVLLTATIRADNLDTWFEASPDKKLLAVERRVADSDKPARLNLDSSTLYVCAGLDDLPSGVVGQGAVRAQHTFTGLPPVQIRWSPDSKFLLLTTTSSGGHSPRHFWTFVFCVADHSFRNVEAAAGGPIGAPDISFEPPDVALLKLYDPDSDTRKLIRLPLGKVMDQMHRLR